MAKSKSAQIQQDLLASDQGSLYREVMQESYNTIFKASPLQLQASELLAHLERGQEAWSQELQGSSDDAERGLVNQVLKKWPETRTWWNSYRSPVSVPSSDSSSSADDESASEKEEAGNVRQESSRITKPRASLLGKCEAGGHCCQPLGHSENLDHVNKTDGSSKQGFEAGGGQNVCHKCGKTFTRKSSLNRHFQIHSNDKPYRCCTCGIHFSQRAYLNRHMRIHEEKSHSGGVPYQCSDCGESFWRKASLSEHRKTHTTDGVYPCSDCDKSYAAERYLIKHMMQVHSGANLCKCSSCEKHFVKEKDLIRHQMESHPEDNAYQCPDCGKSYREKSSLLKHQKHHREELVCKFPDCRKSFKDSKSLAGHCRAHKTENPQKHLNCQNPFVKGPFQTVDKEGDSEYVHTCPDCGKCFKNGNCFANHQRTHVGDQQGAPADESVLTQNQVAQVNMKDDTCFDCGKPLCTNSVLGAEPKAETEKNANTCSDYGKIFRDQQTSANEQETTMKGHQEVFDQPPEYFSQPEMPPNKRPYGCSSCGRTYATHYNLRRHQQVHPECRPPRSSSRGKGYASRCQQKAHAKAECHQHKCTYCGKVFNTKSILCRHMEIHIKGKPYKCTVCGKAFAYRYTLAHHQESHKEEQLHPHKCSFCGKAFRTSTSLRRHQQLHLGSKPYKCNICGKAFSYRYALTHHREIHVEGQFHKCSFCWKAFRTNHSLSRHKRIHTETRSYQCAICGKVFGTKYSLLRHQDMHENGRSGSLTSIRESLGDGSHLAKNQANATEVCPNKHPGCSNQSEYQETHMIEKYAHAEQQSTYLEENSVHQLDGECPARKSLVLIKDEVKYADQFSQGSTCFKNETDSVGNTPERSGNKDNASLTRHHAKENCIKGLDGNPSYSDGIGATWNEASQSEDSFNEGSLLEHSGKGGASRTSSGLVEDERISPKEDSTEELKNKNPISDRSSHTGRQGTKTVKKKHMCSSCGKCYRDRYSLTTHQRTHTLERPYQCQTCEKSFRSPKDLKRHCLTHTDLRPFLCTECGKCFKSKSGIDKHLKAHKGEKPFCCSYCGKRVTTNSILRCHLRIHTGERPFKCTMCGQGYRSGWILKKHLEKHLRMNSSKAPRTNELQQSF